MKCEWQPDTGGLHSHYDTGPGPGQLLHVLNHFRKTPVVSFPKESMMLEMVDELRCCLKQGKRAVLWRRWGAPLILVSIQSAKFYFRFQ